MGRDRSDLNHSGRDHDVEQTMAPQQSKDVEHWRKLNLMCKLTRLTRSLKITKEVGVVQTESVW